MQLVKHRIFRVTDWIVEFTEALIGNPGFVRIVAVFVINYFAGSFTHAPFFLRACNFLSTLVSRPRTRVFERCTLSLVVCEAVLLYSFLLAASAHTRILAVVLSLQTVRLELAHMTEKKRNIYFIISFVL